MSDRCPVCDEYGNWEMWNLIDLLRQAERILDRDIVSAEEWLKDAREALSPYDKVKT